MFHIVFGGAGFIGCNLVSRLLSNFDNRVVVIDNFVRGKPEFLNSYLNDDRMQIICADIAEDKINDLILNFDFDPTMTTVWHLAANSDIPAGVLNTSVDLKDTFLTTVKILDFMKFHKIKNINFASSSAIYGDHGSTPLIEGMGECYPISNYGAMKLASEAVICAACESYIDKALIFRFPNVVGAPATHGVIFDFINRLSVNSEYLDVLGDGSQQKPYLHVDDLIEAMLHLDENCTADQKFNPVNIGPDDLGVNVREISEVVSRLFGSDVTLKFGDQSRGWTGDVPQFKYSIDKLKKTGWTPKSTSRSAIQRAAEEIFQQLIG